MMHESWSAKLAITVLALTMPAIACAEPSGPRPSQVQVGGNDDAAGVDDIDEDFSIVAGLSGGPTSYLDGIKEMPWVLKFLDQCGLDEQRIRESAAAAFMRTKLNFVRGDVGDFFERPLFQMIVTGFPASSGCAASISARVIAPIEGARFVDGKRPLQNPTYVTIWESMYEEGGRVIYEPNDQITAGIEAAIATLIDGFAEAWTHSQGIGHPKYGAP